MQLQLAQFTYMSKELLTFSYVERWFRYTQLNDQFGETPEHLKKFAAN